MYEVGREQIVNAARLRKSPSTGAKVQTLLNTQVLGRPDVMYNHRPLSLSPPPIVIYHPVFNKFRNLVTTPVGDIHFSHDELNHALRFLLTSTEHYSSKEERHDSLQGIADAVHTNMLITTVYRHLGRGTTRPSGSVSFPCPLLHGLLATAGITELKNDLGEGDSDPIAQSECAYISIVSSTKVCEYFFLIGFDINRWS